MHAAKCDQDVKTSYYYTCNGQNYNHVYTGIRHCIVTWGMQKGVETAVNIRAHVGFMTMVPQYQYA